MASAVTQAYKRGLGGRTPSEGQGQSPWSGGQRRHLMEVANLLSYVVAKCLNKLGPVCGIL